MFGHLQIYVRSLHLNVIKCFLKLSSLSIASLRILDEEANKSYDRKHDLYQPALLTRCYTQHALRPYIDSEINHVRHFIKIPFINKGIDFIDLPSIFRDNTVESYIPNYFENKEPPVICYKYNKPIRSTIFNFNKLVVDLEIFFFFFVQFNVPFKIISLISRRANQKVGRKREYPGKNHLTHPQVELDLSHL